MPGAMFKWTAPVFARLGSRWGAGDADALAAWLEPHVPPEGRLLDLGGGTGALAALLAARMGATVTILDASPHMLRHAEGLQGVTPVRGDAGAMPFDDAFFDAVLVCDAFHHFTAPLAAAREAARVVRPGGGVVILEPDPRQRVVRAIAWVERLAGEPGHFLEPRALEGLMASVGIEGRCESQGKASYAFVGSVMGDRSSKRGGV